MPINPSPSQKHRYVFAPSMANNPALCGAIRGHLGNEMPAGAGGTHAGAAAELRQQPSRPPAAGSVYPRPERDRRQLSNHTVAHHGLVKTCRR
jgi:hypothetical protein